MTDLQKLHQKITEQLKVGRPIGDQVEGGIRIGLQDVLKWIEEFEKQPSFGVGSEENYDKQTNIESH